MSLLIRLKQNNYFLFELFILFRLITLFLPRTVKTILIQDKICLVNYNQSAYFCQNIEKEWNGTEALAKDRVLSEVTQFSNYINLIESIGMVIWSLFAGSFLDRLPKVGTFIMLALNIFSDIFASTIFMVFIYFYDTNAYFLLIASLSPWFTGGLTTFGTTALRYISVRTEENSRVGKFVMLEVIFIIGGAFATFLGGQLLVKTETGPRLRTYSYAFLLAILLSVLMVGLLVLLIYVDRINQNNVNKSTDNSASDLAEKSSSDVTRDNIVPVTKEYSNNILAKLFDLNNLKQTIVCFFKPRANNVRLQIYLLCIVLFNGTLVTKGLDGMLLTFSQKVYHWTATQYSSFSAIQQIVQMVMMGLISIVLMKLWKLQDRTLMIISVCSVLFSDLIRGLILSAAAYFVSIPIGALGALCDNAIKSKISKIVPQHEIGKIFSLTSTVQALVPFVASLIYSNLLTLTISSFPGVIYLLSCAIMTLSIAVLIIEWRFCPVTSRNDTNVINNLEENI